MLEKILKSYDEMRKKYYKNTFAKKHMQVVITISPKAYYRLMEETRFINVDYNVNVSFVLLCCYKTPVIIENNLPEDVDFIIQYREDYERLEKQKLFSKFYKMFEE